MATSSTSSQFEIRVAVIGYVSVGKSTVINALFGAEYGQVSMRRTTAVVNHFRICSHKKSIAVDETSIENDSVEIVELPRSPSSTLMESIEDNAEYRNKDVVKEKTYDIQLDEPLHPMRDDTKLVVVDIPGINEADQNGRYRDFVNAHWHQFDVAIIVMDGRQGKKGKKKIPENDHVPCAVSHSIPSTGRCQHGRTARTSEARKEELGNRQGYPDYCDSEQGR